MKRVSARAEKPHVIAFKFQHGSNQPCPQDLLLVKNGGRRYPWPRLPKWLQKFVRISLHKHDEMSSFCLNTVSDGRKQTGLPDAGDDLRKSHFLMCHVTKCSTIRGVYQQPWPGVSPTAILNEEKALGTRLPGLKYDLGHAHRLSCECKKLSCSFFPPNFKHCVRAEIRKKI